MTSNILTELVPLPTLEKTVPGQAELHRPAISISNETKIKDYRVGKQLGGGNYGNVFLGIHSSTGEKVRKLLRLRYLDRN